MSSVEASAGVLGVMKRELRSLLREEQIVFCTPGEADERVALGLFLYNIQREKHMQMTGHISIDSSLSQRPPLFVSLSLAITPYVGKKSETEEDFKLLDRVLQLFYDRPVVPVESKLQPEGVPPLKMELLDLEPEEVSHIWQFPGAPYRTSLFYRLRPVAIVSTEYQEVTRVRSTELRTGIQGA